MKISIKTKNIFLCIILTGFVFFGCKDDGDVVTTTQKKTDSFQAPETLEGSVWVHHPDTDPESSNWFNLRHSPNYPNDELGDVCSFPTNPVEITFTKDGITDGSDALCPMFQSYFYSYTEPYVNIILHYPTNSSFNSMAEYESFYHICKDDITFDHWECNSKQCNAGWNPSDGSDWVSHANRCVNHYWFIGKIVDDTMHLQQRRILDDGTSIVQKDVRLIRVKS